MSLVRSYNKQTSQGGDPVGEYFNPRPASKDPELFKLPS